MIRATDIHSLTDFQRNAKGYIQQVTQTKMPIALTVNGQAEVVVQDVSAYQQMVDELENARLRDALRAGEQAITEGRTRPAASVLDAIKAKHGF